jgi:hypothetical protein
MKELIVIIDRLLKKILEETLQIRIEKSDCQKFYYEVLFTNIRLFEGALFLLNQYKESSHFQVSFISIMRDIISNLILVEFISQKENDPLVNIDEELEKIYSEHYRFKKKSRKTENILFRTFENHVQFEEYFDKFGEKYNSDTGEIKPHLKTIQSTYQRIRYIYSKSKKEDKPTVRILFLWYTEFSKIAHFGELTVPQIANSYNQLNENQVYSKYNFLLKTVTDYIVGLFAKIIYEDPLEEEIILDLEKILEYENDT